MEVSCPQCKEFTAFSGAHSVPPAVTAFLFFQEVLLKRAADLVEALYGMPHNNQVGGQRTPPPRGPGAMKSRGLGTALTMGGREEPSRRVCASC